jgi:transcriptional regulator with XRE-family HTH domain
MDMNINSHKIRSERDKRAWSQEHLATVSGLGLRAIQRVESTGIASYETAKAIASVLDLNVADIRIMPDVSRPAPFLKRHWIGTAAATGLLALSVFIARDVFAGQLMLDVGLTLNGQALPVRQVITDDGKDAEVRIDGQVRLVVQPSVNAEGMIVLATQIYEFNGSTFALVSKPKLIVQDNKDAELRLDTGKGLRVQVVIRPHKL